MRKERKRRKKQGGRASLEGDGAAGRTRVAADFSAEFAVQSA
jgi:hypothetical protein